MPTPHAIDAELSRLASRKRLGSLLILLPVVGILFVIAAGARPSSPFNHAVFALGSSLVLLGIPLAPLGLVVHVLFSIRLQRRSADLDIDRLPDLPLQAGDRLASWRITHASSRAITLLHEPGPRIVSLAMRLSIEAILLAIAAVAILGAVRSGYPSAWVGAAFVLAIASAISASLGGGRLTILDPAVAPSIRFSGHRLWSIIRIAPWSIPFERLEELTTIDGALLVRDHRGTRSLSGFPRGPFGRWQMRRLQTMVLGPADPTPPEPIPAYD